MVTSKVYKRTDKIKKNKIAQMTVPYNLLH